MISITEELTANMDDALGNYDIQRACGYLLSFMDKLNNWYIRRSRRRFWKSENDGDKKMAYNTLYKVLMTYIKLACPVIPFICEEIYQNLRRPGDPESVHLCDYPVYDKHHRDYALEKMMDLTMQAIVMGRSLRSTYNLKTRQPLKKLFLVDRDEEDRRILSDMSDIIAEELNVKEVEINSDETELVDYSAKANFKALGSRLGKAMKEVAANIQKIGSERIARILDGHAEHITYGDNEKVEVSAADLVIQRTEKENLKVLNEGRITIGFDTEVDQNLLNEGLARDIIRAIQTLRKESGFDVSDRIVLEIGGDEVVKAAYEQFKSMIESETLTVSSSFNEQLDAPESDLGVRLSIRKA